jgi:lipopolysaccharide/colanic/teichoic acid biosynthesis glycosyltransferase
VVGLLPVLVAIGLAVKATSRGPVLVRQPRPRSDGGEYRALVFRTAPTRSERSSGNAGAGMTWIGQVLRRLSLVDLPRLFDVVRGDVPLLHAGHG